MGRVASVLMVDIFSGLSNGLRACILPVPKPTTGEAKGVNAFIGDWLTELANNDILSKRFIKTYLNTKSSKAAPGVGRSVSINS